MTTVMYDKKDGLWKLKQEKPHSSMNWGWQLMSMN